TSHLFPYTTLFRSAHDETDDNLSIAPWSPPCSRQWREQGGCHAVRRSPPGDATRKRRDCAWKARADCRRGSPATTPRVSALSESPRSVKTEDTRGVNARLASPLQAVSDHVARSACTGPTGSEGGGAGGGATRSSAMRSSPSTSRQLGCFSPTGPLRAQIPASMSCARCRRAGGAIVLGASGSYSRSRRRSIFSITCDGTPPRLPFQEASSE